jgi:hypothetical protein
MSGRRKASAPNRLLSLVDYERMLDIRAEAAQAPPGLSAPRLGLGNGKQRRNWALDEEDDDDQEHAGQYRFIIESDEEGAGGGKDIESSEAEVEVEEEEEDSDSDIFSKRAPSRTPRKRKGRPARPSKTSPVAKQARFRKRLFSEGRRRIIFDGTSSEDSDLEACEDTLRLAMPVPDPGLKGFWLRRCSEATKVQLEDEDGTDLAVIIYSRSSGGHRRILQVSPCASASTRPLSLCLPHAHKLTPLSPLSTPAGRHEQGAGAEGRVFRAAPPPARDREPVLPLRDAAAHGVLRGDQDARRGRHRHLPDRARAGAYGG